MHEKCSECQYRFEREPGFFLGAIYVNYGLTAIVVTVAYPLLTLTNTLPRTTALIVVMSFAVVFPILIFRHSRSIWMAFDSLVDQS